MVDEQTATQSYQLPLGIVTRSDVGRLVRETESIDGFLHQATIRQPGFTLALPKTSALFNEFVTINKLNMLKPLDRQNQYKFLQNLSHTAPVVHISFSNDPSPLFLQKLISWMRQQLHPNLILHIGLQPTIGAGCVIRTTNKQFDLSLKRHFDKQKNLLIEGLIQRAEPLGNIPVVSSINPGVQ